MVSFYEMLPSRRKFTLILLIILIVFSALRGVNSQNMGGNMNPEWNQPRFNYSYNASEESLRLEVSANDITPRRGSIIFDETEFAQSYLLTNSHGIEYTNIWSHPSLLDILVRKASLFAAPLALEGEQLAEMPLEKGDYVEIEKDFTDTDGDGYQGIENNETIEVYNLDRGVGPKLYAYVSVTNDTVRVFRFGSSSDRKWMPCDLEREKLCETVQAYNFD